MLLKKLILSLSIILSVVTSSAWAKVSDPAPLLRDGIEYSSHMNEVVAKRIAESNVLWRTTLPIDPHATVQNSALEADVQLNIIVKLVFTGADNLLVQFDNGEMFSLETSSGKWHKVSMVK